MLLNLYRDEHDHVGWHSDDEPELGKHPVIASLSLGETRIKTIIWRAFLAIIELQGACGMRV